MSFSYLIGNLIGRGLSSYALVCLLCIMASRFNWRLGFTRSRRWYSLLAVVVLSVLGMGAAIVRQGGIR
jgi:hypothetical protein